MPQLPLPFFYSSEKEKEEDHARALALLREVGPSFLTDRELLELLGVGSGKAVALLERFGLHDLPRLSLAELQGAGLGEAEAARIRGVVELARRLILKPGEPPVVHSPADAANLVRAHLDESLNQEQLWVILLNTRNAVLGVRMIYQGNVNSIQVRPAEVFREAVARGAPAIVVAHNHPSGTAAPSREDLAITRQIVQAGHTLGIEVQDHVIVAAGGYYSLWEHDQLE